MKHSLYFIALLAGLTSSHAAAETEQEFHVLKAASLEKVFPDGVGVDHLLPAQVVQIDLAKDEAESFQLVVVPTGKSLDNVQVELDAPQLSEQRLNARWNRVGYVRTGNPSYPVERVGLWPDVLLPGKNFSVTNGNVGVLWVTITAPPDALPGTYTGVIRIGSKGSEVRCTLQCRVRTFSLPRPGTLAVSLGLYAHTLSKYYDHQKEGDRWPVEQYVAWAEFLASRYRASIKDISGEYRKLVQRPNAQGISEIVELDLSPLDKTVGVLAARYFPDYSYSAYRMTSGFVIRKWLDEKRQDITPETIAAPVKKVLDAWRARGFSDKVFVYGVDEPDPKDKEVIAFIKKAYWLVKDQNPNVKILQTIGAPSPELAGAVDIWCPKNNAVLHPFFAQREAAGDRIWNYVCISPVYPNANLAVDQPSVDYRALFWLTWKSRSTGFLYWSTTWWEGLGGDEASGFDYRTHAQYVKPWQHMNGDGLLLYPGKDRQPLASLRLEILRDGVEDYEYLVILKRLVAEVEKIPTYQTTAGQKVVAHARELMTVSTTELESATQFNRNPEWIFNKRLAVGNMIEQLQDILSQRDYQKWKGDPE
jgi:hypothetical protein